jgi:mono/diheme cytochrome c family protein
MQTGFRLALAIVFVIAAVGAFVVSGQYDIGADSPHWPITQKLVATLRDRSVSRHAVDIAVPDLDDDARIRRGAHHYAEMCASCHLTPGMTQTELREGLYPQPPNLAHTRVDPREAFWVIKHGVKMSAMSAWGKSHDDEAIWDMVAFIRKLPTLDEKGFIALSGMPGNTGHEGTDEHHHDEHDSDHMH